MMSNGEHQNDGSALNSNSSAPILCSECFHDQGLRLDAQRIGFESQSACPNCHSLNGRKLAFQHSEYLAHSFFVRGSFEYFDFGGAPVIQFNDKQTSSISLEEPLRSDAETISQALGIGFFYYGPRLWMLGEIEPLKDLARRTKRKKIFNKIIDEYPIKHIEIDDLFYRVRLNPEKPESPREYDSAPRKFGGKGRLDTKQTPILYGSQDLTICIHECRVAASDKIFVATLAPTRQLNLLDLTQIIDEEVTEFESLDMAIHFLFLARENSYPICRYVASEAKKAGYDGLIFPSFFSLLRTGGIGFQTLAGMSMRRLKQFRHYEQEKTIPNLAIFGRPLKDGTVGLKCINRLFLEKVEYNCHFGPAVGPPA